MRSGRVKPRAAPGDRRARRQMVSVTPIRCAEGPDGLLTYAIALPPQAIPPVRPRDLLEAWDAAREAATAEVFGPPRLLRFAGPGGQPTTLALADRDAAAWAAAVDLRADLATLPGLALCLRLLALVEVLPRARFLRPFWTLTREGAEFHPALVEAAARMPLDAGARFDAEALRALLSRRIATEA